MPARYPAICPPLSAFFLTLARSTVAPVEKGHHPPEFDHFSFFFFSKNQFYTNMKKFEESINPASVRGFGFGQNWSFSSFHRSSGEDSSWRRGGGILVEFCNIVIVRLLYRNSGILFRDSYKFLNVREERESIKIKIYFPLGARAGEF